MGQDYQEENHKQNQPPMKFTLTINCSNSAFKDDKNPADDLYACLDELARLLRIAAMNVESGSVARQLHDANGNVCGRFDLNEES